MNYREILDSYRDEACGMLRRLVSFKSVLSEPLEGKPFGEEIHGVYKCMLSKAEEDGFEVFDAGGYGGHIDWLGAATDDRGEIVGAADETLGIAVHLDVVPAGDGWTHDPWACEVSDGKIFGRGTADNKGPAVMVYFAMKALRDAGYMPAKNVRLLLGLDEETGCTGMDKYFEQAPAPDFGFAPDMEFPVIYAEKGILTFEIAKKLEQGHETGLYLRSVEGGAAPNMVPDRCRAIIVYEEGPAGGKAAEKRGKGKKSKIGEKGAAKEAELRGKAFEHVKEAAKAFRCQAKAFSGGADAFRDAAGSYSDTAKSYSDTADANITCKGAGNALEIMVSGKSAHGSTPEKGINAISIMMEFLSTLPLVNESARDFVDFYHTHIGSELDGESLGIAMEDSVSGSLVLNSGMISMNKEAAVLTVNVRYPISKKEEDIYGALRPVLDRNGLGVVKLMSLHPLYFSTDEPLVKTLIDVYRENTGDEESKPIVTGGGTYARSFPNAVAYGPKFPGEEDVVHQKDEYISIDSLMKAACIYADAICRLTSPVL